MKQAINSLFRKGQANVVKIICLSIGLALGLLMIAEVIFERSYDNYIPRLDDTYRVTATYQMQEGDPKEFNQTSGAHAPGIKNVCPEVEAATRYTWLTADDGTFLTEDNLAFKGNIIMTDSSFFDVFPRKILFGEDPHKGLNEVYQAYISSKLLETLGTDIIGKTVRYKANEAIHCQIVGAFEAFPENTHLPQMDILLSLPTYKLLQGGTYDSANNWLGNDRYRSYVRLAPGVKPEALQSRIDQMVEDHIGEALRQAKVGYKLTLKPIRNIILTESDYNRMMNYVFMAFGIIMLAVSILNYILLVVSSMVNRAKSIATYRCYGASGWNIYKMILSESFLHVVCISLPIAILIMLSLQDFIQENIAHSLKSLFPVSTIIVCVIITLAVTLVCGLMPGYLYTKIPVTYAYRRYSENKRHWKLGLLFAQFLLAAFFVNMLVVLGLQYSKMTNYDLGFDYQNTLAISLRGIPDNEAERAVQELKRDPLVAGVSWAYQSMENGGSGDNVINTETNEAYMNIADLFEVGDDFHEVMGIPIIEGKAFTPGLNDSIQTEIMVSRSFVERMREIAGWEGSGIGKEVFITSHEKAPTTIVGVYEDLKLGSFVDGTDHRPSVMYYGSVGHPFIQRLYVRLNNYTDEGVNRVQEIVNQTMTTEQVTVMPMRMLVGNNYEGFKHVRNAVLLAGLSIFIIAMIGLIAYLMDEVNRRKSEIAIRKIVGATVMDVQRIFQRDLSIIALPAMLIGLLLAWYVSQQVLQLFEVKIALTTWLFGGCTVAVLCLVLLVSAYLVWQASRANPTENLRTE
ncbi:MAG: ABC transporter permease [Bacteroidaceae bacterium]|nr:ABC transporter permease [Bacteroidaceae bacterium]